MNPIIDILNDVGYDFSQTKVFLKLVEFKKNMIRDVYVVFVSISEFE
jgi:hypothetical protein